MSIIPQYNLETMARKTVNASKSTSKVQVIRYASNQANIAPYLLSDMSIDTLSATHGSKNPSLSASSWGSQSQSLIDPQDPMREEWPRNPFSDDYAIDDSDFESIISQPLRTNKPINPSTLPQPDKLTEANLKLHEIATWRRPDLGTRTEHKLPIKESSIWELSKIYGLPAPWDSHYNDGNSQHTSDFFGSEDGYFKTRGFCRWRGRSTVNRDYWQWKEEQSRRVTEQRRKESSLIEMAFKKIANAMDYKAKNDLILQDRLDREIWKRWEGFKKLHPATTLTYDRVQRKFDINRKLFRPYWDSQQVRQEEVEKNLSEKWLECVNACGEKVASKEQLRSDWEATKRKQRDEESNKHWEGRNWRRQHTKSKEPLVKSYMSKAECSNW